MSNHTGNQALDVDWIRKVIVRYGLPVWFLAHSSLAVVNAILVPDYWLFDGRLYLDATRAWLAGGDPWAVSLAGNYFAAPPPTLLPLAPLAALPEPLGLGILTTLVAIATVATVRLLGLPWWWILFPPVVQCLISANVQAFLVPLILVRVGWLAVFFKIYGAVPMGILGRWRELAVTAVLLVATIPLLPWATFIADFSAITGRLAAQTDFALPTVALVLAAPAAVLSMSLVGRDRAAWLAVPALWPSQQYYYGGLAIGARDPIAAAIVALPLPGSGLIALFVIAALAWRNGARPARFGDRTAVPGGSAP